jgi:hypothetical protein
MHVRRATLPLFIAIALATTAALAGDPKTPLGKWMKPNIGVPMAGQDFATLQTKLGFVASKVPSGSYGDWAKFAQGGADAAGKQDVAGVKAACKGCHDKYKQQYITDHLNDPFP